MTMTTLTDDKGTPIQIGDTVQSTHIDRDRGSEMWMHRGVVVGIGRTRVKVKFPSRGEPQAVGNECLRVVGRPLPTVTFTTNLPAALDIVAALDEVLGIWDPSSEAHQTQHALLTALRSELASLAKEAS